MFFSSVKSSMQTFLLHDSHNTGFSNAFFFPAETISAEQMQKEEIPNNSEAEFCKKLF